MRVEEYDDTMTTAGNGDEWCELTPHELPISDIYQWAVRPDCGAVVLFSGTVRDHADGRTDVTSLEYEAYDDAVIPVFTEIAAETRRRFPDARRIAILHRTGLLELSESSVVVAVSSAHRPVAFDAARFAIDALKESAPIWKKENWAGGSNWGTGAHDVVSPSSVGGTQ
jgi:molybdopterin synthase catalytic subunit